MNIWIFRACAILLMGGGIFGLTQFSKHGDTDERFMKILSLTAVLIGFMFLLGTIDIFSMMVAK